MYKLRQGPLVCHCMAYNFMIGDFFSKNRLRKNFDKVFTGYATQNISTSLLTPHLLRFSTLRSTVEHVNII